MGNDSIQEYRSCLAELFSHAYSGEISMEILRQRAGVIEDLILARLPEVYDGGDFPELTEALDFVQHELHDPESRQFHSQNKNEIYYLMKVLNGPVERDSNHDVTLTTEYEQVYKYRSKLSSWFRYAFNGTVPLEKLCEKGTAIEAKILDTNPDLYERRIFHAVKEALDFIKEDLLDPERRQYHSEHKQEIYYFLRLLGGHP